MSRDAVIFSGVAFLSTLTGGLAAARFRTWFGSLAAFVAGVLIAVPLFDLLPEVHEKNPPLVSLLAPLSGFLVIFAIMQVLWRKARQKVEGEKAKGKKGRQLLTSYFLPLPFYFSSRSGLGTNRP